MIESGFELMIFYSETMLNHYLTKKFKLIGRDRFNHLINTLTDFTSRNILVLHMSPS